MDVAPVSQIMDAAPVPATVVVSPIVDNRAPFEEIRQARETRNYIALWSFFVMFVMIFFIAMMHMFNTPNPPVCAPPSVCAPITTCAAVLPTKWDVMTTCVSIFFAKEE